MNFTDFITHHGRRVNKEYFISLIQVSRIDGKIAPAELEMLYKEGIKFGLSEPEIETLINSEEHHTYHAPYSLKDKFEQLYNVAVLILADGVVSDKEKRILKRFATEAGFEDKSITYLVGLLLKGIKENECEEDLLEKFKEHLFK